MPAAGVDYSGLHSALNNQSTSGNDYISTPYGLSILELQGDLVLPHVVNDDNESIKVESIYDAVKFGCLELDPDDRKKVTLFVGKSQRLLGSIEDLDVPLAVMKVPADQKNNIKLVDVIKKKITFKIRPLPIMSTQENAKKNCDIKE